MCCTVLVRPGLQPGAQTFQEVTSNLPNGEEGTETGVREAMKKNSHGVALQVGWILKLLGCLLFSRQIRAYLIPSV